MLKLIIFVILCGGLQLSHGEKLKCEFKDEGYSVGTLYSCYVTSLDNSFNNVTIDGYTGVHMASKNENDVKAIYIESTNLKYIPEGIGAFFNLLAFRIWNSQLIEIRSKDFYVMENLETMSFAVNKLTSVPSDGFSSLTRLKFISFSWNQIKYIGSGVFDQMTNLNAVYLSSNICVNKNYEGPIAITQMKEDIKTKCKNPNEVPAATTTTTTTQNPMEVELEALKNELTAATKELQKEQLENLKVKIERNAWINEKNSLVKELYNKTTEINELKTNCKQSTEDVKLNEINDMIKTLLKASEGHQVECQEIFKLRAELVAAKKEQKMTMNLLMTEQEANTKVLNEGDQMKKELSEAKKTIKDFNMEVMDLKIERHNERQNSIALRTKLMEAKEKLAECKIDERMKLQTECETKEQELMSKIEPTEEELICDFKDETYNILGLLYSCDVKSLDNKYNNKVIKGQNGVHQVNKNATNVKAIYISETKTTHIPEGLGSLFNLTAFQMFNTQLKEIRIKDFENMENLEYFNFDYNKLTSVPLEVLKMLNKLKYISLQSNLISELTPGLFDHNLELVEVYLDRNRIQVIGSGFFNRLTKLTIVHMTGNKCVDKIYEGSTEMVQMRKDVELNCKDQQ